MDIFENLRNNIHSIAQFKEQEWDIFLNNIEIVELKKDEYLLKQGTVCDFIGFLSKGIVIYFKDLENGNEVTTDFGLENDWITNNYSRLLNVPSTLNIKAIEPSILFILKNRKLENLYNSIPGTEKIVRVLMEHAFIKITQQTVDLQTLSATDRYLKLLSTNREVFQKIPQYHIANYLGIAPKSLSRIRNTIFKAE